MLEAVSVNKTHEASVRQWRSLHDKGYFANHKHTREWPVAPQLSGPLFGTFLNLEPDDDVLEIGCGYGSLMYAISDRVKLLTGVDVHPEPLKRARDILHEKTNVCVLLTDGISLPFDDKTFSVIYSYAVMQHIPRSLVEVYIREACRVLKPAGRLCIQFPDANKRPPDVPDIDTTKIKEQSTAWTPEELRSIVNGIDMEIEIHESPPRSLYLVGKMSGIKEYSHG
jgi:SAM-dependent methyltransferase